MDNLPTFDPELVKNFDRLIHANAARLTGGLSPAALGLAWADWAFHLATSPGKQAALVAEAARRALGAVTPADGTTALPWPMSLPGSHRGGPGEPPALPAETDRRFSGAHWQQPPYNLIYRSFLAWEAWWQSATRGLPGVEPHHEAVVAFMARQVTDMFSPSNALALNPELLAQTAQQSGLNLARGAQNALSDASGAVLGQPADDSAPRVGRDLAVTPGKVVLRNPLMELIQYAPATPEVHAQPLLIVPAWIMKYYILDLSAQNSLVRFLVERGHTVFMISWKNPGPDERDRGMDDYLDLGVFAALAAVEAIVPGQPVHVAGYCLGGTLAMIAAAQIARHDARRLASLTLFAAQADFTEAGELTLFIDEAQVALLEDMMWAHGGLDARQMAGAFQMLRSNDLIWSRMVRSYLLGEREHPNDLMAWNADATRMPYRMHSEYLRQLFLHNDLAEGRYHVRGEPVALNDLRCPLYVVGTETDHVAPWRSVYKLHLLADSPLRFILTTGGHNAGIVSEPGHPRRSYKLAERQFGDAYIDPDQWLLQAQKREGSWWLDWADWLAARSGARVAPPALGAPGHAPLCDAPGQYVLEH
ncbi:PHA/PHB synthase family protein [Derxia lacustris]|uniref:PHA/PHB synthase family protein n=1 Tax=Derxia lacustris TaxID=764842 RepID=UPI000A172FA9|nr:alpha/beta fold hydrolase [Derxia lacustris]